MHRALACTALAAGSLSAATGAALLLGSSGAVADAGAVPPSVVVPAVPAVRPVGGHVGPRPPPAPGPPDAVAIPSLGVRSPVVPVRVGPRGAVQVPADVATVGWVAVSGRPGDPRGTAVLVGHVDDATGRLGTLAVLAQVRLGARVSVQAAGGGASAYVVRAVRTYDRYALPADLFTPRGRPRLALVTCTGRYDRASGGYPQNLVVWAAAA